MMISFLDEWLSLDYSFVTTPNGQQAIASALEISDALQEGAAANYSQGLFPKRGYDLLHQKGLMGATIPTEAGGLGLPDEEYCALAAILGAADPSLALSFNMHCAAMISIDTFASDAQKERIFAAVVNDGAKVSALGSEPGLKAFATGALPQTQLHNDGGQWRMTGRKSYSSFGANADLLYVVACIGDEVSFVCLPAHQEGVSRLDDWNVVAMKSTNSVTTVFDAAPVAECDIIRPTEPKKVLLFEVEFALGYGPIYLAMASRAVREALRPYTSGNIPRERAGELGLMFDKAGDVMGSLRSSWLLCRDSATAAPRGTLERARDLIMAKAHACETAARLGNMASVLRGGRALAENDSVGRLVRDMQAGLIMAFSPEDARSMLGRVSLGFLPDHVQDLLAPKKTDGET